jgi:hypothetical protein
MLRRRQAGFTASLTPTLVVAYRPFSYTQMLYKHFYSTGGDRTLTRKQAESGKFSEALDSLHGDFRSPSNKTLVGHPSGYHEPFFTTDSYKFFRDDLSLIEEDETPKSATLQPNRKSSFHQFKDQEYFPKTLKYYRKTADGFRTDTARTILSSPDGKAAGHSGSGLSLKGKGQADAHDALRETLIGTLQTKPTRKSGVTTKSIACIQGAVTLASMAPGELARTVQGSLKDRSAGSDWEERRNEAKRRLDKVMSTLTPEERQFVISHTKRYFQKIQSQGNAPRSLAPRRSRSPLRTTHLPANAKISGGRYIKENQRGPSVLPPEDPELLGHYFTEPFRAARRILPEGDI